MCVRIQSPQKCFYQPGQFFRWKYQISEVPPDMYPLCSNCITKEHVKGEVNKIHLLYKSMHGLLHFYIVWCIELSVFIYIMNNDLPPASYFENLETGN